MRAPLVAVFVALGLCAAACGSSDDAPPDPSGGAVEVIDGRAFRTSFPPAPSSIPSGSLDPATASLVDTIATNATTFGVDRPRIVELGEADDPRLAWLLVDLLRLYQDPDDVGFLVDAFESLTGVRPVGEPVFRDAGDVLGSWDLAAWPGYARAKGTVYGALEPRWLPFFEDADAVIDWRWVTWGGVFPDDRPVEEAGSGARCRRGCVPALVDPPHAALEEAIWLRADEPVFGVRVEGDTRAYPVFQVEAHEVIHDALGGRRVALVFCTLCRSAQAFLTDDVPAALVDDFPELAAGYDLRTSGLLLRSNKLTYDRTTDSLIESFTGRALSGPMRAAGVVVPQVSVVTSPWSEWWRDHRETTVLARDGGIGRVYDPDPLGGRDDRGPIFAIGEPDPRLDPQTLVLGVVGRGGSAVAFPVAPVVAALNGGDRVRRTVDGLAVEVVLDGGGLRAIAGASDDLVSHEAFWFAWSQFRPDTEIWAPG